MIKTLPLNRPQPQPNFDSAKPSLSQRLAAHRSGNVFDAEIADGLQRIQSGNEDHNAEPLPETWKSDWKQKNLETFKNWMYLWLKKGNLRDPKKVEQLMKMHQDLQNRGAI